MMPNDHARNRKQCRIAETVARVCHMTEHMVEMVLQPGEYE